MSLEDKKNLELHRKKMFDYKMVRGEPLQPLSKENDSRSVLAFRKIAKKLIEENEEDKAKIDEKIAKRIRKGKKVDIAGMYNNLIIRPYGFQVSLDGKFSLIQMQPSSLEIIESKKLI